MIMIHMFNIEHGHDLSNCGDFAKLPLPCNKTLWQASDERTWEIEYRKQYSGGRIADTKSQPGPTYQDLLPEFLDQDDPTGTARASRLSKWFMGIDELGILVTMAVSAL